MEPLAHPAGLERYRALLRTPHARRLFSFSLLARLPIGMTPLALLLLVRETGAGYGAAGAVSAAYFVAAAIAAPISGRLVDKRGATSVLLPRAILSPGLLLGVWALAAAGAPLPAIAACAAAAGALLPPISAALRSLWPRLLDGPELRSSAYALEASLQEVFFVLGPLLVAVLAAVFEPGAALAVGALAGAVGTLGFALTGSVRAYRPEAERDARGFFGALEAQGVRTIVLYSACCGLAFGGVEVAIPAFAEAHGGAELGGIPLALFAGGSLVGGLVAGARSTGHPLRLLRLAAAFLLVALVPPLLAGSLPVLSVLVFVAGLPIAPGFAASYNLIDAVARRGTAAEAFAWIGTAISTGIAAGIAVGGILIDSVSVRAAFGLGLGGAVLAALLAASGRGLDDKRPLG